MGSCFQGELGRLFTAAHGHLRAPSLRADRRLGRGEQAAQRIVTVDARCAPALLQGAMHVRAPLSSPPPPWACAGVGTPGCAARAPVTLQPPLGCLHSCSCRCTRPGTSQVAAVQCGAARTGWREGGALPEAPGTGAFTWLSHIAEGGVVRRQRGEVPAL